MYIYIYIYIYIFIYVNYIFFIYYIFSKNSWTNLSNKVIDKLLNNILYY